MTLTWHRSRNDAFATSDLRIEQTSLGQLVTVDLEAVPDLHTLSFTLALPEVHLDGDEAEVTTFGVWRTAATSIGGPALVKGQLDRYKTVTLKGTARAHRS